jgi:predicted nucleic acid-binding protein
MERGKQIVILVDTNIIIDFWNKPSEALKKIFAEESIAICGVVKAELMRGAKSDKDLNLISEALSEFKYIDFNESIWNEVGKVSYLLRKNGITVPFQDIILCALSIKHDLILWTNDNHFSLIKTVIKDLKLFDQR